MGSRGLFIIIKSFLLWLIVFISSTIIGALVFLVAHKTILSAILIQLFFIVLSMITTKLILRRGFDLIGFSTTNFTYTFIALLLSTTIATLIAYTELHMANTEGFKFPIPGIEENSISYLLLAVTLAPIGEETLFRGLLLGYMLEKKVNPWIAIIVSASLFSFVHIVPFSVAPITQQAYVISTAFIMSILAGYLRKKTASLLPAITTHIGFNLGGFIITIST